MGEENKPTARSEGERSVAVEPEVAATPLVDIIERPDAFVVLADMPGVERDGLEVVFEKGVLTIRGKARSEEQPGMDLLSSEYQTGTYYRAFTAGRGLDADRVEATFNDGVLRLVIPKSEQFRPRRIEVKGE